jgi:hypothetical protein
MVLLVVVAVDVCGWSLCGVLVFQTPPKMSPTGMHHASQLHDTEMHARSHFVSTMTKTINKEKVGHKDP